MFVCVCPSRKVSLHAKLLIISRMHTPHITHTNIPVCPMHDLFFTAHCLRGISLCHYAGVTGAPWWRHSEIRASGGTCLCDFYRANTVAAKPNTRREVRQTFPSGKSTLKYRGAHGLQPFQGRPQPPPSPSGLNICSIQLVQPLALLNTVMRQQSLTTAVLWPLWHQIKVILSL